MDDGNLKLKKKWCEPYHWVNGCVKIHGICLEITSTVEAVIYVGNN